MLYILGRLVCSLSMIYHYKRPEDGDHDPVSDGNWNRRTWYSSKLISNIALVEVVEYMLLLRGEAFHSGWICYSFAIKSHLLMLSNVLKHFRIT